MKSKKMRMSLQKGLATTALLLSIAPLVTQAQVKPTIDPIATGFRQVPVENRMSMYWRVFGPAWEPREIDRQLEALQRAGIGGVMTSFFYPLAQDNPSKGIQNQTFLSPNFLKTLQYAAGQSHLLGMRFGFVGGSGWPYGGPTVGLADSAQRIHMVTIAPDANGGYTLPNLQTGESLVAALVDGRNYLKTIKGNKLSVTSTAPCRLFIAGSTKMEVKRPALGGEGYVLNHLNRAALQRYLESVVRPMAEATASIVPTTLFCDSLEVYRTNWTSELPAQFRREHGYDLIPNLETLFGKETAKTQDIKYDFWHTIHRMAEEEFARTLYQWSNKAGVTLEMQAYGTPSLPLTAAQYIHVPSGEQYEWRGFSFMRYAASGAHLAGRKRVNAEAWTWIGYPNRLADTLSDMKLCSDLHFLAGANDLTGVDYPYSPRSAEFPGWIPYYGPFMNNHNPQWETFPNLVAYVNRCQWMLQQGTPVADVLLYLPTEDSYANASPEQFLVNFAVRDRLAPNSPSAEFQLKRSFEHQSEVIEQILTSGYNYDGIDSAAMRKWVRVQGDRLVTKEGNYRIVVLPNLTGITLESMEKIAQFCRNGGTVIATTRLPERVYGKESATKTLHLRALVQEMFGDAPHKTQGNHAPFIQQYGEGRAIFVPSPREGIATALVHSSLVPDVRVTGTTLPINHVHRKVEDKDIYFVTNINDKEAVFTADFRVGERFPSLWNPLNGQIEPQTVTAVNANRTTLQLRLPPRGSVFVCFNPSTSQIKPLPLPKRRLGGALSAKVLHQNWDIRADSQDFSLTNQSGPFTSWSQWKGMQNYSGKVTYSTNFDVDIPWKEGFVYLQCEKLHESAEITINEQRVGAIWLPPYRIDVTRYLKPGRNSLQIKVANLPINRYLVTPDMHLEALRKSYGSRFPNPTEKQLVTAPHPSGILGEVSLVFHNSRVQGELP